MANKRKIKIELTGPLKANKATIKLIAEAYLDWMEQEQRKQQLDDAAEISSETDSPRRKDDAEGT